MSEHEPPNYDDWFDEPEPPTLEAGRGSRQPYDAPSETEEDVWTLPEDESRPRSRRSHGGGNVNIGGHSLTTTQIAILAIAALAIFIAILAAAGVFSSTPASTLTTNSTPTTLNTTTAITTTVTLTVPTQPLHLTSTGPQVKLLQAALKSLGFYTGPIDGQFGTGTEQAVVQFQTANGLTADGYAGTKTLKKLKQQVNG